MRKPATTSSPGFPSYWNIVALYLHVAGARAGGQRDDPAGVERPGVRADRLRLSVADAGAAHAHGAGRAWPGARCCSSIVLALPERRTGLLASSLVVSRRTTRPVAGAADAPATPSPGAPRDDVLAAPRPRSRGRGPRSCSLIVATAVAVTWIDAAGLRRPPADARRRRHLVSRRRTAAAGSGWTSGGRTCRCATFPPTCSTPSSRSRTTASTSHVGVDPIALGRAVFRNVTEPGIARRRVDADPAARPHAVPVEPQDLRPQAARSGAGGDDRRAAVEGPDPRAVPQSHLPERRRLRRRDDVAASVRQAGEAADAGRVGVDCRAGPRAGGAVALEPSRGRRRAEPRRAGADARRRVHHRGAGAGGAARADPRAAVSRRDGVAGRLREGLPAPVVPGLASAATIRPTGTCRRRSCRSCRTWRSARSPTACGGSAIPSCRPRWSRSIPATGTCSRWSAAVTSSCRSSTAPAAAGVSQGRRSSRCSTPRRSSTGSRRCRCSSDLGHVPPQGPEEWSPRNAEADAPDTLTLRAALFESDNRAATVLQQRVGHACRPQPAPATSACATCRTCRRCRSGPGWSRHWISPPRSRCSRPAAWSPSRAASSGSSTGTAARRWTTRFGPSESSREETAFQMVSMLGDVIDRGTGSAARAQGVRFAVGGKTGTTNEFKDAWFVGFSSSVVVGRLGRVRSAEADRPGGLRVALRAADLERLHAPGRPPAGAAAVRTARRRCATSRSAASRI